MRRQPSAEGRPPVAPRVDDWPPLPVPALDATEPGPLRVCIASPDVVGPVRNGGVGTAYTNLAEALATAGHAVTLLYTSGRYTEAEPVSHWSAHYRSRGITFVPLPQDGPALDNQTDGDAARSYATYRWLRGRDFDLIHFPEMRGHGYYSLLAKHQGLAFNGATLCVGTHGPTLWHKLGNGEYLNHVADLTLDFLERRSVALADVVVSPSRYLLGWMQERGWSLPEGRCFVQQNLRPPVGGAAATGVAGLKAVDEVVFFGRLEERKGLVLFCDALDRLAREGRTAALRVTFLGKAVAVQGRPSLDFIADRARSWPFAWQAICDRDRDGALAYLRGGGRLALIPSLVENSPFTVLECLEAGVPFLASDVGGIPELVAPDDRADVLVRPRADALARRLGALSRDGARPARAAAGPAAEGRNWLDWHAGLRARAIPAPAQATGQPLVTVCMPHFNRPDYLRQALGSIGRQDYPNLEVVVVDDGSTDPAALAYLDELERDFAPRGWHLVRQENRYPGAARNAAAARARGEYLLFMDDDNIAKPHEVATLVAVARRTGADILTAFYDAFDGDAPPGPATRPLYRRTFLGDAAALGALVNVFGDCNTLVRRAAFDALGGFTEDHGINHEDWEFLAKAVLTGFHLEVVPEALFWYRLSPGSVTQTTPHHGNHLRSIRPYLDAVPAELRELVLYCQGSHLSRPLRYKLVDRAHALIDRAPYLRRLAGRALRACKQARRQFSRHP